MNKLQYLHFVLATCRQTFKGQAACCLHMKHWPGASKLFCSKGFEEAETAHAQSEAHLGDVVKHLEPWLRKLQTGPLTGFFLRTCAAAWELN